MKLKTIQLLGLITLPLFMVGTYMLGLYKHKQAKSSAPQLTATEVEAMVARFDLEGWNASGEEILPRATQKANT